MATYADYAVRDDPEISFNAVSHRCGARVERASWERACGVIYADFAVDGDTEGPPGHARDDGPPQGQEGGK